MRQRGQSAVTLVRRRVRAARQQRAQCNFITVFSRIRVVRHPLSQRSGRFDKGRLVERGQRGSAVAVVHVARRLDLGDRRAEYRPRRAGRPPRAGPSGLLSPSRLPGDLFGRLPITAFLTSRIMSSTLIPQSRIGVPSGVWRRKAPAIVPLNSFPRRVAVEFQSQIQLLNLVWHHSETVGATSVTTTGAVSGFFALCEDSWATGRHCPRWCLVELASELHFKPPAASCTELPANAGTTP